MKSEYNPVKKYRQWCTNKLTWLRRSYKKGRYYTWHTWNTRQVSVIKHSTGFTPHRVRNSSKNCFKKSAFSLQRAHYISGLMKAWPVISRMSRLFNFAHCVLFQKYKEWNTKFQQVYLYPYSGKIVGKLFWSSGHPKSCQFSYCDKCVHNQDFSAGGNRNVCNKSCGDAIKT